MNQIEEALSQPIPLAEAASYFIRVKQAAEQPDVTGELEGKFDASVEEVIAALISTIKCKYELLMAMNVYKESVRGTDGSDLKSKLCRDYEATRAIDYYTKRAAVLGGPVSLEDPEAPDGSTEPEDIIKTLIAKYQRCIAVQRELKKLVGCENPMEGKIQEFMELDQNALDELWQLTSPTSPSPVLEQEPASVAKEAAKKEKKGLRGHAKGLATSALLGPYAPDAAKGGVDPDKDHPAVAVGKVMGKGLDKINPNRPRYASLKDFILRRPDPRYKPPGTKKEAAARMRAAFQKVAMEEDPQEAAMMPAPALPTEQPDPQQALMAEAISRQAQGANEAEFYRERLREASEQLQQVQEQAQQLEQVAQQQSAQLEQAQMTSQQAQAQAQQTQMMSQDAIAQAQQMATQSMQHAMQAQQESMQAKQEATGVRINEQQTRGRIQQALAEDPNAALHGPAPVSPISSPPQNPGAASQQQAQPGQEGDDPNKQPGAGPSAEGNAGKEPSDKAPADNTKDSQKSSPASASGGDDKSNAENKKSPNPAEKRPSATIKISSAQVERMRKKASTMDAAYTTFKNTAGPMLKDMGQNALKRVPHAGVGAVAGALAGAHEVRQGPAGLRQDVAQLQKQVKEKGNFRDALALAAKQKQLSMREYAEENPGKYMMGSALTGAGVGASVGPKVVDAAKNMKNFAQAFRR